MLSGAAAVVRPTAQAAIACDRSATPSTFASQVSAATSGQTVCLESGSYGTWSGTNKAITVAAAAGATPTMKIAFTSGDSGFTLDGMSQMGGTISGGANHITVRNSSFTSTLNVSGSSTDAIVLDGNQHNWNVGPSSGGANSKIFLDNSLSGTMASPSVTISDSQIANGDLDGVHIGGGSGYQIVRNSFKNLCDQNANHTDNIQFDTSVSTEVRIAGNYVYAPENCYTQGITSYDAGTSGVLIEDNVVDIARDWGIELYADRNSTVRHNTVVYHSASYSIFNSGTGQIAIDRKSDDPAGTGTRVYDNLAYRVNFVNGSTGTSNNNVSSQSAVYVGPTTAYPGFVLSPVSPSGLKAASDGLDAGARVALNLSDSPLPTPTPTPTPSSTPSPTDKPADAVWTAPSNARVGTATSLDGTRSTGDGSLSCRWSFEDSSGSTVYETQNGCSLQKTFQTTGTKYVELTVTDADGDTDSNKQSFDVASASSTPTPTPTPTPPPDAPADAVWTAPSNARVGTAVTLDATRSTGNGPLTCTWTFENADGSTLWEPPVDGCTLQKTFKATGVKYVKVTVTDADGDTDSNKQSFSVS